jgi:hypothetical protein|tara:strand:- start:348 stop:575 length:228 start_codon:yes stop_codon:yes gene_type:complete
MKKENPKIKRVISKLNKVYVSGRKNKVKVYSNKTIFTFNEATRDFLKTSRYNKKVRLENIRIKEMKDEVANDNKL